MLDSLIPIEAQYIFSQVNGISLTSRALFLGLVAFYFALLAAAELAVQGGFKKLWWWFGVGVLSPDFADLRTITHGIACAEQGLDVLVDNPCDPWQRPMNYPRVWLALGRLGVGPEDTWLIGLILVALYFVAVALIARPETPGQALLWALAVTSPSAMLAVERGNNDLAVFALLAFAAIAWASSRPWIAALGVVVAAALKIYPALGLALFATARERADRLGLSAAAVAIGGVMLATVEDIGKIAAATPRSFASSYGARVIFAGLDDRFHLGLPIDPLAYGLAAAAAVAALIWALRAGRPIVSLEARPDLAASLTVLGCAIFAGSFLIGNNFDYRLIFLLMWIPHFLRLERLPTVRIVTLVSILGALWLARLADVLLYTDEIFVWILFVISMRCLWETGLQGSPRFHLSLRSRAWKRG